MSSRMGRMAIVALGLALSVDIHAMGMMGGDQGNHMGRMMGGSNVRQEYFMRNGIGPEYTSMRNPLSRTEQNIQAGKDLFEAMCAACHGKEGHGDGPAAAGLDPPPGNIAGRAKMPMATDGYLFWTIAEGGQPIGTQMPAFGGSLEDEQIWQLILYLRSM